MEGACRPTRYPSSLASTGKSSLDEESKITLDPIQILLQPVQVSRDLRCECLVAWLDASDSVVQLKAPAVVAHEPFLNCWGGSCLIERRLLIWPDEEI